MRIPLTLAAAAFALAGLAPAAEATCMTEYDERTGIRRTTCAAPGGPVTTTYCFRDVVCHTFRTGGPGGGGGGGTL